MKRILIIVLLFSVMSCDYFNKEKVYTEDLLEEELKTFSWNEVDEYPTFDSCDSTLGKSEKRQCFEKTLLEILNKNLSNQTIVVTEPVEDTVSLKISIDSQGNFAIIDIQSKPLTTKEIPQLDSLLRESLQPLPKIYPAIKRSQQVTTQFTLPVIIRIE